MLIMCLQNTVQVQTRMIIFHYIEPCNIIITVKIIKKKTVTYVFIAYTKDKDGKTLCLTIPRTAS